MKKIKKEIDSLKIKNTFYRNMLKEIAKKTDSSLEGSIKWVKKRVPANVTSKLIDVGYEKRMFVDTLNYIEGFEKLDKRRTNKLWQNYNEMIDQKERKLISKLGELM